MRIAGYIFIAIGAIAFIGSVSAGHSPLGSLFWLALGIALVSFNKKKEKETLSENEDAKTSKESSITEVCTNQTSEFAEKDMTKREDLCDLKKTYWERYKLDNPEKASLLSSLYDIDFSMLSDKDVRERISTVDRLCKQYQCTISQLKGKCLKDLEQFPLSFFDQLIEMTIKEMETEAANFNVSKENTACALLVCWMKERKTFLETNNVYSKSVDEQCLEDKLNPEDAFKKRYSETLIKQIGNNANIPLFCEGYDSPIAQELMDIMYAFLNDKSEKEKADKLGYGNRFAFIIIEETEKVVKKYCHAALQECIEHYNFPNKEVVTSFRCPCCGSWDFFSEEFDEFECMKCGHTWRAQLGYNLYLKMNNYGTI